jgi:hypothetical protein
MPSVIGWTNRKKRKGIEIIITKELNLCMIMANYTKSIEASNKLKIKTADAYAKEKKSD